VKAWLPPTGRHVDILDGTVYDSDRVLTLYRPLSKIPVLAPEGSIIPLDAHHAPENGGPNPAAFEVIVIVGKDGKAKVIEDAADDNTKEASGKHEQRESTIEYAQSSGTLTTTVTGRKWSFRFLSVASQPKDITVKIDGKDCTKDAKISTQSYPDIPSIFVECPGKGYDEKHTITISLGENPQLSVIDHMPRMKDMVRDFQIEFGMKDKIWTTINGKGGLASKMGNLMSLDVDEVVRGPIEELLLADFRT
jgi:hypothetical protein